MKKISLLIFLFICLSAKTQNTYYNAYNLGTNAHPRAIIKTLSGGLAVLFSDTALNLLKTDLDGNIIWKKRFHYSLKFNPLIRLTQDLVDSSFYVSACYYGNNTNSHLLKIDNAGNLLWSKTVSLGGVYICGSRGGGFILAASANYDNNLLRFDNGGNIVWQNRYQNSPPNGGAYIPNIFQCTNGDYVITASCINNAYDPQIYRVDSSGVLKWFKMYDLGADNELVNKSAESNDQSILVCGNSNNSVYYQDFYFRVDSVGNLLNFRKYHSIHDPIYDVILSTAPNRVLMMGNAFYSGPKNVQYLYTYLDYTGTTLWNKTSGNTAGGGGYDAVQCGVSVSPNSFVLGGGDAAFVAMIDSSGNGFCNADTIILKDTTYPIPVLTPTITTGAVFYSVTNNVTSITIPSSTVTTYCNFTLGLNSGPDKREKTAVFPNPVSSNSFFEFKSDLMTENSEITINDILGRRILSLKLHSGNNKIPTLNWQSGIYFYTIVNDKKTLGSGKICVVD